MSTKEFSVAFEGPAVEDGAIDVSDLAPALLAIGDLFRTSNRLINGEDSVARLNVRAEPHAGCFEIDLEVVVSLGTQVRAFLTGSSVDAAKNLFELIIGGSASVGSLVALYRFLRGKKPAGATTLQDGTVSITVNHETKIFNAGAVHLYNHPRVRQDVAKMGEPLRAERLERIDFRDAGETIESVSKAEAEYLQLSEEEETEVGAFERTVALQVITATFDDSRLWRMSDGSTVFNVGIEDPSFLAEIEAHQTTFGKGDVLRVDLRSEQTINASGKLQTRHTVTRVIEKIPAPQQIPLLPFGHDDH